MLFNRFWRPLAAMLVFLAAFPAAHAACAGEEEQQILLINHPKLWSAPSRKAAATAQAWHAGQSLLICATRQEVDPQGRPLGEWRLVQVDKTQGWMPAPYLTPPPQPLDAHKMNAIGEEPVDRDHGLPADYAPQDLESIGPRWDKEVNFRLRREAAKALAAMIKAAQTDGVHLLVVSGYRSWEKQQELYERRVNPSGWDQTTVAKPGHSEHQLGTAVDLNGPDKATLLEESFGASQAGRWLHDKAWQFGFAISFTAHNQALTGCAPEPWHYRYWGLNKARSRHLAALGEPSAEDGARSAK